MSAIVYVGRSNFLGFEKLNVGWQRLRTAGGAAGEAGRDQVISKCRDDAKAVTGNNFLCS